MLEIRPAIGPESWVSGEHALARREAMQALFFDYAERPEQTGEDWPEDRALHAEMVVIDPNGMGGERIVGTGMLVVDHDRADCPARIWGMGVLPSYRTDFVVKTLEEALLHDGACGIEQEYIEGADGRLIPNPYAQFDAIFDSSPTFEA